MVCYKDGDISRGGFRFICNDIICIDFCADNYPYNNYIADVVEYINENHISKIFVNSPLSEKVDISFLCKLNYVEEVKITADCISLEPLSYIKPKILRLYLQEYPIDFSTISQNLEDLWLFSFDSKYKKQANLNTGILQCNKLRKLRISNFRQTDCDIIGQISTLNELSLSDCLEKNLGYEWLSRLKNVRKLRLDRVNFKNIDCLRIPSLTDLSISNVNIDTLFGLRRFVNLKNLEILYCKKLVDIKELRNCANLRKLEIDCCKKVEDFECLRNLKNLEGLIISNCGNIPSIAFIDDMPKLRFFSFVDTNIVDGDLTPCMRLEYVGTMDKRHYNIKAENLPHRHIGPFQDL